MDDQRAEPSHQDLSRLAGVDLNLLVLLQVLLQEQSVSRAATRIGLSQSAMSHGLNRCRRLFDDELLSRVGKSLQLTPRGRALLTPVTELLRSIDQDLLKNPGFSPASSERRFRVSLTSSTAMVVIPPLMQRLRTVAPGVSVQTVALSQRAEDALQRPETDLVLLPDSLPSVLPRERLYDDRWVVALPPDHPTIGGRIDQEQLVALPHVVFDLDGSTTPPYRALEAEGHRLQVYVRTHDFLLLPFLLLGSDSIAIVQERMARRFEEAGLLRVLPLPVQAPRLRIDMVWNPRSVDDPACRWLREALMALPLVAP